MTDTGTLAVYDRLAGEYSRMAADWPSPGFDLFVRRLPRAARVLDLGCGPGNDAARMVTAGLDVLAVDGSAEMVARARAQPGVTARRATFDDIPALGAFDGVWASFSLLHAPKAAVPRHLAAIRGTLRDGGVLGLGMKLGAGEGTDDLGRFYVYYSDAELRSLVADAGMTVRDSVTGSDAGLAGKVEDWVVLVADV